MQYGSINWVYRTFHRSQVTLHGKLLAKVEIRDSFRFEVEEPQTFQAVFWQALNFESPSVGESLPWNFVPSPRDGTRKSFRWEVFRDSLGSNFRSGNNILMNRRSYRSPLFTFNRHWDLLSTIWNISNLFFDKLATKFERIPRRTAAYKYNINCDWMKSILLYHIAENNKY